MVVSVKNHGNQSALTLWVVVDGTKETAIDLYLRLLGSSLPVWVHKEVVFLTIFRTTHHYNGLASLYGPLLPLVDTTASLDVFFSKIVKVDCVPLDLQLFCQ